MDFSVIQSVAKVAAFEDPSGGNPAQRQAGELFDMISATGTRIREDGHIRLLSNLVLSLAWHDRPRRCSRPRQNKISRRDCLSPSSSSRRSSVQPGNCRTMAPKDGQPLTPCALIASLTCCSAGGAARRGHGKQRRGEKGDEKMLRHAFAETTRRAENRQIRVEFRPPTEDSSVELGILLQPGGFRLQALGDRGIVNADELLIALCNTSPSCVWILATGFLLPVQTRDRDANDSFGRLSCSSESAYRGETLSQRGYLAGKIYTLNEKTSARELPGRSLPHSCSNAHGGAEITSVSRRGTNPILGAS